MVFRHSAPATVPEVFPDAQAVPEQTRPVYQLYLRRLAQAEEALRALDARAARLANLRGVTFVAALIAAGLTVFHKLPAWGWALAGLLLGLYALLAWRHHQVCEAEDRTRLRRDLNARGASRLCERWHQFPNKGERYLDPSHLYAPDLDLFGQGSLFQLMDETGTTAGEARLAGWLTQPAPLEEARTRQGAVKELAPLLDYRQALLAESRLAAQRKANPQAFIDWAERHGGLAPVRWARFLPFVLPPLTLAVYLAVPGPFYWIGLFLQVGVVVLTRKTLVAWYERLRAGEGGFVRYEDTFAAVERQTFSHPRLQQLRAGLAGPGTKVSERLRRFGRLFGFVELRESSQLHVALNFLVLWDLLWFFRLEAWRQKEGAQVRAWFDALSELEALGAVAGFAHDHPHYCFPELKEGPPSLVAQKLGHPLLVKPVRNDLSLQGSRRALLITGSNMSGKTTLLRAMGINTVMAFAGFPVCAEAFQLSELRVLTSMRVKDSLERGVSYFYAEVQRMKSLLDAAQGGRGLFLLDEILMGTNTRERQLASRELLRLLLRSGSIGAVTTHDLSLTELASDPALGAHNVHFRDLLEGEEMRFDYRLREGVVETTNALRVLRKAGIPIQAEE